MQFSHKMDGFYGMKMTQLRNSSSLSLSQGATFIETMIVVVVVAFVAIGAIVSFQSILTEQRLIGASERFYNDLHLAQATALEMHRDIYVDIRPGTNWCYGLSDQGVCGCSSENICTLGGVTQVIDSSSYPGIVLSATNIAGNNVTFDGTRGTQNKGSGTVTFTDSNNRSISINLKDVGSIRICSNTVGGYAACS